ncbi:MAG: glycosyltransferase [Sulfolobales archaeon]
MILEILTLSVLLSSAFIQSLHIFYGLGFLIRCRAEKCYSNNRYYSNNSIDRFVRNHPRISVIIPMKNEDLNIVRKTLEKLAELEWNKESIEIIVASDDPVDRWKIIEDLINDISIKYKVKIWANFRENPVGGRNGAINEVIKKCSGDLILILDADSIPEKDFLLKLYNKVRTEKCDAVVGRWIGYSYFKSKIGEALSASTDFIGSLLFYGREYWGFYIVPLGSGTLFTREVFDKIGLIEYDIVQDDYWIGLKMFGKGLKTCYEDTAVVKVMVPSTYRALKIQQSRWSFGAVQAGLRGINIVRAARDKLYRKFEIILYAFQYLPTILTAYSPIAYAVAYIFIEPNTDPILNIFPYLIMWIMVSLFYAIIYYHIITVRRGSVGLRGIKWLGTSSALLTSLSPFIAYNQLRAIFRKRIYSYRVTPKGSLEKNIYGLSDIFIEAIILLILVISTVKMFLMSHFLSILFVAMFIASYAYTIFVYFENIRK